MQGAWKKIEHHLLAPERTLTFGNPGTRLHQFVGGRLRLRVGPKASQPPQARLAAALAIEPGGPVSPIRRSPVIQQLAFDPELTRHLAQRLARRNALQRSFLELRR